MRCSESVRAGAGQHNMIPLDDEETTVKVKGPKPLYGSKIVADRSHL